MGVLSLDDVGGRPRGGDWTVEVGCGRHDYRKLTYDIGTQSEIQETG